jgi:hypothetical protein
MVFVGMEGKSPLYEHGHQVELHAFENVVQTPPNGHFDHEDLLWEVIIQHTRMQQGPCFVEVAFISTTRVLDFIVGEEGKDGGQCRFLCKKCIIHLDNDLQQL